MSRYKRLYCDRRARPGVTIQRARAAIQCQCPATWRRELRYARQCDDKALVAQRVTRRAWHSTRHGRACARHDQARSTTRRQCAPRHGTTRSAQREVCAQPGPWVCEHCALDSVLTQCTVLSHCLGHYS